MRIGIISSSLNESGNGIAVARWVLDYALSRQDEDVDYELVVLKDYDLAMIGHTPSPKQKDDLLRWSTKMASFDGYIIVTPEYNRSIPGSLKNALDYLQEEVHNKAVGYVSYGGLGGLAAIEALRLINAEQELASVRTMITFSIRVDFIDMKEFKPKDYHKINADKMFHQLLSWSKALQSIRK